MAKALVGMFGGHERRARPSWLANEQDIELATLRRREAELIAEIAELRADHVSTPVDDEVSAPDGSRLAVASYAGAQTLPQTVQLDRELVSSDV